MNAFGRRFLGVLSLVFLFLRVGALSLIDGRSLGQDIGQHEDTFEKRQERNRTIPAPIIARYAFYMHVRRPCLTYAVSPSTGKAMTDHGHPLRSRWATDRRNLGFFRPLLRLRPGWYTMWGVLAMLRIIAPRVEGEPSTPTIRSLGSLTLFSISK